MACFRSEYTRTVIIRDIMDRYICGGIFYRVVTMRVELLHVCVPYLRFRHFGATVALLPVPDRYIMIGGLVDGAQIVTAVSLGK